LRGETPVDLNASGPGPPPIVLNDWTVEDLEAGLGDVVTVEYYLWEEAGALLVEEAQFRVAAIVPIDGLAADQDFAPDYPGITEANDVSDWDPPFPIDLGLVRPKDEDYWDEHRTVAKGFIPLASGQDLWGSRWGEVTSLRLSALSGVSEQDADTYRAALRLALDPLAAGFVVYPARGLALEAAAGVTDFGEYFTYFSFFLVVSALLLASLFFRLGVEQRLREIGALRALGFHDAAVRRLFWAEAGVLSFAGANFTQPLLDAQAKKQTSEQQRGDHQEETEIGKILAKVGHSGRRLECEPPSRVHDEAGRERVERQAQRGPIGIGVLLGHAGQSGQPQ
jgi:hypothetical protein